MAGAASTFAGEVVHVTDGDTLWVRPDGGRDRPVKLRLQGIDAPERCQAWGAEATAALGARLLHRHVQVRTRARDVYGRSVASVSLAGQDVGAWMVSQGHAWSESYRRRRGPYSAEEQQARAARRGLFADGAALPPRRFRREHGACR